MKYLIGIFTLFWVSTQAERTPIPTENSTTPIDNVYDDLAKDICNCAKEIISIDGEIRRLYAMKDLYGMERLKQRIPLAYQQFDRCMAQVERKYKKENIDENRDAAYAALKKHCPDIMGVLEVRPLH